VADVERLEAGADVLEHVGVYGERHIERVRGRFPAAAYDMGANGLVPMVVFMPWST
jgi:hypothetical protein